MFKQLLFASLILATSSMAIPDCPNPCDLCEFVVASSQNFLAANHTTRELQIFFNHTCDLLGSYAPICRGAVVSFVPKLIYILEDEEFSNYTAQEICVELKICEEHDVVISPLIVDCEDDDFYKTSYCSSFRTNDNHNHKHNHKQKTQTVTPAPFTTTNLFADVNDWDLDFADF
jgi:hypothetical protein